MTNSAPQGEDFRIQLEEEGVHIFRVEDFSFEDADGDGFAGIQLLAVSNGQLRLNGAVVQDDQFITAAQLDELSWGYGKDQMGTGQAFLYQVVDDSGLENDTSAAVNMYFKVTDVLDVFRGTPKKDVLRGTIGADVIDGKGGNDRLIGNSGRDFFIFSTGYGKDTVVDTQPYSRFDLSGLDSIKNFRDLLQNHVSDEYRKVVIDGGDGDMLILKNLNLDDLDQHNFIF